MLQYAHLMMDDRFQSPPSHGHARGSKSATQLKTRLIRAAKSIRKRLSLLAYAMRRERCCLPTAKSSKQRIAHRQENIFHERGGFPPALDTEFDRFS